MATDNNLIRAGLPWSSPLKIIVQASEVINDATINRGLLNLLNNDYYLDLKTQALNNYIESNIGNHINDKSIHFTIDSILDLIGNGTFLKQDSTIKIPVVFLKKTDTSVESTSISSEKINQLIDSLPKHLNGHILLVQFIYAINSKSIINEPSIKPSIDTSRLPICFNGFSNGTLLIRSNTAISAAYQCQDVDLITNIAQFSSTADFNQNLSNILKQLNSDTKITGQITSAFTFSGNGINKFYSSFAITDTTADVYLLNCNIQNTLSEFSQEAINAAKKQNKNALPQQTDLLALFLCNQQIDNKIWAKQKYTDLQVFPNNVSLDIKTNKDNLSSLFKIYNTETWFQINNTNMPDSTTKIPDYLQFSNDDETYAFENAIRQYLYNFNNKNNNFSICFFGTLSALGTKTQHAPLFSDCTLTPSGIQGLYVYLDEVYGHFENNIDYNSTSYPGSYESYFLTNNIINKNCFYVIDFITQNVDEQCWTRSCYTDDWNNTLTGSSDYNYRTITNGDMRVNITVYNIDVLSGDGYLQTVCIPNKQLKDANFHEQCRYTFKKPQNAASIIASMKFFANKINYNEQESLVDWNYFTGKIRNIFLFNKILTLNEINSIIKQKITSVYYWSNPDDETILQNISTSSYIGALNIHNSNHVNIVKNYLSTKV